MRFVAALRAVVVVSVMAMVPKTVGAVPSCPASAAVSVFVENRTANPTVTIQVHGEPSSAEPPCIGAGALAYDVELVCSGLVVAHCGTISGLQPGAWINRVAVTGTPQVQARRAVFVAGANTSNPLVWTVYPRTLVVTDAPDPETSLRAQLDCASGMGCDAGVPTLMIFSRTAFPGAHAPRTVTLMNPPCDPTHPSALCVGISGLTVDALDDDGDPGAVVVSVGAAEMSVLRVSGSGNVFRGLAFRGTVKPVPMHQVDAVSVVSGAIKNRFEQCVVSGPTFGDALSVEGSGTTTLEADANVIDACELSGAKDKGLKVTNGGRALIRRSCVHDNRNGGVQATLGGHVAARENLVQHNVPGRAQNGLSAGSTDARTSTLVTDGNLVRFAGGRGLSVSGNAVGTFSNDYVADGGFVGGKVETSDRVPARVARGTFRGVAFVCNHNQNVSGSCLPQAGDEGIPCDPENDECCLDDNGATIPGCTLRCGTGSFRRGFGADQVRGPAAVDPDVDYGTLSDPGRNAFTLNPNPAPQFGANLRVGVPGLTVPAEGNQWEHCLSEDVPSEDVCDTASVLANDVQLDGAAMVTLGAPSGPRADAPILRSVSPRRPRAGDIVRVYGENFNAIDGAACAGSAGPLAPCSAHDPEVRAQNTRSQANRVRITAIDGTPLTPPLTVYPDAVTPTMLVFAMPIDCFAPMTLEVQKQKSHQAPGEPRLSATIELCDPASCAGLPAGTACDDRSVCTVDDQCTGGEDGVCRGMPLPCAGQCLTGVCHPRRGCESRPQTTPCDDGDACTVADHCGGIGDVCVPGAPVVCGAACMTGACDPLHGCVLEPATTVCRPAADRCDVEERCDGLGSDCPADAFLPSTVECRFPGGPCDAAEFCPGSSAACPPDGKRTDECRPPTGACDEAERCDGVGNDCPPDAFAAPTVECQDGNRCTEGDHCDGGADVCVGGSPVDCDDANVCTDDACRPDTGCVHTANSAPCDDSDACTHEQCAAGACVAAAITPQDRAACELGRLTAEPPCGTAPLPRRLAKAIGRAAGAAQALLREARHGNRRLCHAERRLHAIERALKRALARARISVECGDRIRERLERVGTPLRALETSRKVRCAL